MRKPIRQPQLLAVQATALPDVVAYQLLRLQNASDDALVIWGGTSKP
jgi:hypothetical protein